MKILRYKEARGMERGLRGILGNAQLHRVPAPAPGDLMTSFGH